MTAVIEARGLSKRYQLGVLGHEGETFREFLIRLAHVPLAVLGRRSERSHRSQREHIWALKDLDFDVSEGEVVGVIGRNGAGKSTLLKVLSRITQPTEGRVTVEGRLACLLEVGTGFHPELTGRENVFLNGAILGMRKTEIHARFDEIVAFAEVEQFIDTPVKRYSSGMFVRLAFAVAAHLDPEILVVDEVLSVGDVAFQKKCIGKMSEVSQGGRTVLFVSHNMATVEGLCDRCLVLDGGRLQFEGSVGSAIQYYLSQMAVDSEDGGGSSFDLSGLPRRDASAPRRLKRLDLYAEGDRPVGGGVSLGRPLKVVLTVDIERVAKDLDFGIRFETLFGQVVLATSTRFCPERMTVERPGEHTVVLEVPQFTLLPGEYRLKVTMVLGSTTPEVIDDAARLSVIRGDFYGTGRVPRAGAVVLEHSWRLES